MSKYYGGGGIILKDDDWGRAIDLQEKITVNSTGQEGIVHDKLVGSSVVKYFVEFSTVGDLNEFKRWNEFRPDEITPVENP